MLRTEKILLAGIALFLVSCSNISQWCRHDGNTSGYLDRVLQLRQQSGYEASLPVSTVETPERPMEDSVRKITWKHLSDVIFDRKYDEKLKMPMLYPSFSRNIKALNGKMVRISGYVIPIDATGGSYVLSSNPNSSCFFCGGAGPETIMALKFKSGRPEFETDDYVSFQGRLRLNEKNIYELYYNLDEAVFVGK